MISTEGPSPGTVYLYDTASMSPHVLSHEVTSSGFGTRVETSWLRSTKNKPVLMIGGTQGFILVWPDGRPSFDDVDLGFDVDVEDAGHGEGQERGRDVQLQRDKKSEVEEEREDDSVFDITTNMHVGEDTFQHKRANDALLP